MTDIRPQGIDAHLADHRDHAAQMLKKHVPAAQVVALLMERGLSEPVATDVAYSEKIIHYGPKRLLAIGSIVLGALMAAGALAIFLYVVNGAADDDPEILQLLGTAAVWSVAQLGGGLFGLTYADKQIVMARRRIESLKTTPR